MGAVIEGSLFRGEDGGVDGGERSMGGRCQSRRASNSITAINEKMTQMALDAKNEELQRLTTRSATPRGKGPMCSWPWHVCNAGNAALNATVHNPAWTRDRHGGVLRAATILPLLWEPLKTP